MTPSLFRRTEPTQRKLKRLEKNTLAVIGRVAAGFKFAQQVERELETILGKQDPKNGIKEAKNALHFLRWVNRAERKIDPQEKKILITLEELKEVLPSNLRSEDEDLAEKLKVAEAEFVRLASQFVGDLRKEITQIEVYEEILRQYEEEHRDSAPIREELQPIIAKAQKHTHQLLEWMRGTEALLRQISGFEEKVKVQVNLSRRRFLISAATGVGILLAGKKAFAFAQRLLEKKVTTEQKLRAIKIACDKVELLCQEMTERCSSDLLYTPHADYTHFNRVGLWKHEELVVQSKEEQGMDFGAIRSEVFERQRGEALAARQPTDQQVSITERSLITLANFTGRRKVSGKLLVPKHFPGGPPELELTENEMFSFQGNSSNFVYLKPFQDLLKLQNVEAVMVGHAAYPGLEDEFSERFFAKYELPILTELEEFGMTKEKYMEWVANRPATLSPTLVRGFLGEHLGFSGFIFSDALNMWSVRRASCSISDSLNYNKIAPIFPFETERSIPSILTTILAIYAGIEYLLCADMWVYDHIASYAEKKPYFKQCLQRAIARYAELSKRLRRKFKDHGFEEQIHSFTTRDEIGFKGEQDAWDRGGAIHRYFRSQYLAALYNEPKIADKSYREVFWDMHQNTDWNELDSLYEEVIKNRYHQRA